MAAPSFGSPFVPAEACNNSQLIFLTAVYSAIIYRGSCLINGGSEFLLLIPSLAGLVGSIVLPILGAIPDGMMTLCSGLGSDAQEQVSAGVGVLAGSTVMLLTFPWFIAVWFGRVPLGKDGVTQYDEKNSDQEVHILDSGVSFQESIPKNAKIMVATTLLFFVIQVPATLAEGGGIAATTAEQAEAEHSWALIGMVSSAACFVGYLCFCYVDANEDKQLAKVIEGIQNRDVSIGAALSFVRKTTKSFSDNGIPRHGTSQDLLPSELKRLKKILRPFFSMYDSDSNSLLNPCEFALLLKDLGESPGAREEVEEMFLKTDADRNGVINFDEFTECLYGYLTNSDRLQKAKGSRTSQAAEVMPSYDIEGEEEEEVPSELVSLDPAVQRRRILFRAGWMMLLGTMLVLIFSDPLVDNLTEIGHRLGISPFYIAFVLAPFASNASELLSAYMYAVKRTQKSMTTALSTLVGAACMNNTFCLGIFFALIYFKHLAWQFTAETIAIVLVQWIIGLLAIFKRTHSVSVAIMILACYPFCLFLVWFLENQVGID